MVSPLALTPPVLRAGAGDDRAACLALCAASCAHRDGSAHPGVAERAAPKFDAPAAWIVADADGEVVGFALATPPGSGGADDPPEAVVLGLLAVDPRVQGAGLGRALLSAVTSELAEAGHREAVLHVLSANETAVRLYESAGWEAFGAPREHSLLKRPFQSYRLELGRACR